MTKPLRLAITADPYFPVPPTLYGGIERVVHFLVEGLLARGHHVTLFAHPDSLVAGAPMIPYGAPPHTGRLSRVKEVWQLGSALWTRRHDFDLIHSFGRLASLAPVLPLRSLPKIQSYQRAISWSGIRHASRIAGDSIGFTACSASMCRAHAGDPAFGDWHAIFNGVDVRKYRPVDAVASDAPLVFLGRLEPIKGVHVAIAIARRANRRLIIAGNQVTTGPDREYFAREIAPAVDGDRVRYVGAVDDVLKNALLGSAAALLFPILWEEPFGIVMAEAMACGTPVIAFPRGSVPEVIRDGVNGWVCETADDAVKAVGHLDRIDRTGVRADCEARFDAQVIVAEYEALYRTAVA